MRKPPYGMTYWEWYVEPRWTVVVWVLQRRHLCCGSKRPGHKFDCGSR